MVSHALTVETRQRTPFSLKTPTQVYALASLLQQLRRSWNEQWESNRAYTTLMLQSYDPPKYPPPKTFRKTKEAWLQYKKPQFQAPGTTFSISSNEVRLEGVHGNCYRVAKLAGVHQGAHVFLGNQWTNRKIRSWSTITQYP